MINHMGYYDLVLVLIPLVLLSVTGVFTAAGVALTTAVTVAATVSVGIIGHAMFINEPLPAGRKIAG